MKSRDERRSARAARNAAIDARTIERLARLEAEGRERRAGIAEWASRRKSVSTAGSNESPALDATNAPPIYRPSAVEDVAAMVVPGLGVFQAVKSFKSQKAFLDSLTPEQRLEYFRRNPGIGGG